METATSEPSDAAPIRTFVFADERGLVTAASLFLALALAIGLVAYRLFSDRRSRRPEFQSLGTWSPPASAALAGAIAIAVYAAFAWTSLRGFVGLELAGDAITLRYALPSRELGLRGAEIADVRDEAASHGKCRLVLVTRDGAVRSSQPAPAPLVVEIEAELQRARR